MAIIKYFRDKCIGCGYCVDAAPERWFMSDKDGKATLIGGKKIKPGIFQVKIPENEYRGNEDAAEICPVSIIRVNYLPQ